MLVLVLVRRGLDAVCHVEHRRQTRRDLRTLSRMRRRTKQQVVVLLCIVIQNNQTVVAVTPCRAPLSLYHRIQCTTHEEAPAISSEGQSHRQAEAGAVWGNVAGRRGQR